MNKARWIWAGIAAIAIPAALAAGLWFGGGPTTRDGWEAAAWAASITAALWLTVTAITWAASSKTSAPPPASPGQDESSVANTVNGDVSGDSTVIQGRNVRVDKPTYGGNHNDFRGGTFNGPFVNEQHNHRSTSDENPDSDR